MEWKFVGKNLFLHCLTSQSVVFVSMDEAHMPLIASVLLSDLLCLTL